MEHENLQDVYGYLLNRNLSGALDAMEIFLSIHPLDNNRDRLYAIRSDFQLMTDYWKRGYKDQQATSLYDSLLRRMYALYALVKIGRGGLISIPRQPADDLKTQLEDFVSDVAMLELEPPHTRKEKEKTVHLRHHNLMKEWFDYLLLSPLWNAEQAEQMEQLLLAPTIDSRDQQLLISGITLGAVNCFDALKLRTLLNVYKQTADEGVRQRALVGFVFALGDAILPVLYPEELREIETLLADEAVCQELVELEQQIYLCMNAEKDNQTLQQEIIPELLNNSNFRVTRNGIEEIEDDPMEDILHPDAEERRMEKVEESYRRMQGRICENARGHAEAGL